MLKVQLQQAPGYYEQMFVHQTVWYKRETVILYVLLRLRVQNRRRKMKSAAQFQHVL